ncbi:MAG: flagellar motor switch protein FliM [Chloroflexota bacterium]|nr:MAG: flagellar motor switch protein FliM [Chloroflexota bacterium]
MAADQALGKRGARKAIRNYDFTFPNKFSKEHLRALQMIHENMARSMGFSFSAYLRASVQVRLTNLKQGPYDEFVQSLPTPTVLSIVRADPLPGHVLVELNVVTASGVIERLLGGPVRSEPLVREMMEIEYSLLRGFMTTLLSGLKEAWSSVAAIEPQVDEMVLRPQFVRSEVPGDAAVIAVFEVAGVGPPGELQICTPYIMLEPLLPQLNTQTWLGRNTPDGEDAGSTYLEGAVKQTRIELKAQLGQATLGLGELAQLSPGMVIVLDNAIDAPITLMIGGHPRYLGRPGLSGHKLAVQITHVLEETE